MRERARKAAAIAAAAAASLPAAATKRSASASGAQAAVGALAEPEARGPTPAHDESVGGGGDGREAVCHSSAIAVEVRNSSGRHVAPMARRTMTSSSGGVGGDRAFPPTNTSGSAPPPPPPPPPDVAQRAAASQLLAVLRQCTTAHPPRTPDVRLPFFAWRAELSAADNLRLLKGGAAAAGWSAFASALGRGAALAGGLPPPRLLVLARPAQVEACDRMYRELGAQHR